MKNNIIHVVALFINVKNKILLCKRSDTNLYSIPGGKVNTHENFKQALKREIMEELYLEIDTKRLQTITTLPSNPIYPDFNFHLFSLKLDEVPKIVLNHEHTDFCWTDTGFIAVETMPRFNLALKAYLNSKKN